MKDCIQRVVFQDRSGQEFQIHVAPSVLDLWHGQIPVGHLFFVDFGDLWELNDLLIRDDLVQRPKSFWGRLSRKSEPVDYRSRGLGTALLQHFIGHAKKSGARRIEGKIVSKDSEPQPWLQEWYRKHGFKVIDQPRGSRIVAKVLMDLVKHPQ